MVPDFLSRLFRREETGFSDAEKRAAHEAQECSRMPYLQRLRLRLIAEADRATLISADHMVMVMAVARANALKEIGGWIKHDLEQAEAILMPQEEE